LAAVVLDVFDDAPVTGADTWAGPAVVTAAGLAAVVGVAMAGEVDDVPLAGDELTVAAGFGAVVDDVPPAGVTTTVPAAVPPAGVLAGAAGLAPAGRVSIGLAGPTVAVGAMGFTGTGVAVGVCCEHAASSRAPASGSNGVSSLVRVGTVIWRMGPPRSRSSRPALVLRPERRVGMGATHAHDVRSRQIDSC
jgi:hypothetical protein